jgi:hypothetical protein
MILSYYNGLSVSRQIEYDSLILLMAMRSTLAFCPYPVLAKFAAKGASITAMSQASMDDSAAKGPSSQLRRSVRLHSASPSLETVPASKSARRQSLLEVRIVTKGTSPGQDDSARAGADPSSSPTVELKTALKSPITDDSFVTAVEDISTLEAPATMDSDDDAEVYVDSEISTSTVIPDIVPSSQPPPPSLHSPVPLATATIPSLDPSIPSSASATLPKQPKELAHLSDIRKDDASLQDEASSDSDDEAPQPISLSQSRSEALHAESKVTEHKKAQAEKERAKRRHRDQQLTTQRQEKLAKSQPENEVPDSQGSNTDLNSGNTTDTPAPNQDHQAARAARHAEALPTSILQAASASWLQSEPEQPKIQLQKQAKKRKERDDNIRIVEDLDTRLAPKKGKISITKESMIMKMGRGERKMYVGRFTR